MNIENILKELSEFREGYFPKAALLAAVEQKEELTPHLLKYLECVAEDPDAIIDEDNHDLFLFAMYLVAQFQETRAFQPLIRIAANSDHDIVDFLFGDCITEGFSRILASVSGGDVEPIKRLVTNGRASQYARSGALYSLITLCSEEAVSKESLREWCGNLLAMWKGLEDDYLLSSLVMVCETFRFADLIDLIRECYKAHPEMKMFSSLKEVEKNIQPESTDQRDASYHRSYITDTIAELENWHCFQPKKPESKPVENFDIRSMLTAETYVRPEEKVGRNDPCPCGSGKKFKKCCG